MTDQNWQTYKFADMVDHIGERVDPSDTDLDIYIGLEHLDPESLKIRRQGHPSDVKGVKLRFYPGDIIFGKRRFYQRKLAVADFHGICSAHAMVLRAKSDVVLPEFLPFFMQSETFYDIAMSISVGSLSPTINWTTMKKQKFTLPPLDEQRRIAEILWAVEDAIEQYMLTLSEAKILRLSMINDLIGRGKSLKELKQIDSGLGWKVVTLDEVCTKITDGTHQPPKFTDEGIPFLLVSNLASGEIDWDVSKWVSEESYQELTKHTKPEVGDVLYTVVGSFGVPVLIDWEREFTFQRHIGIIKPDHEIIRGSFIAYYLESALGKKQAEIHAVGNAQRTITLTALKEFLIPVPPLLTQDRILTKLQEMDDCVTSLRCHIDHLTTMKKKLMEDIL